MATTTPPTVSELSRAANVKTAFRARSATSDGCISRQALEQVLRSCGHFPEEALAAALAGLHPRADGRVDVDAFVDCVFAGSSGAKLSPPGPTQADPPHPQPLSTPPPSKGLPPHPCDASSWFAAFVAEACGEELAVADATAADLVAAGLGPEVLVRALRAALIGRRCSSEIPAKCMAMHLWASSSPWFTPAWPTPSEPPPVPATRVTFDTMESSDSEDADLGNRGPHIQRLSTNLLQPHALSSPQHRRSTPSALPDQHDMVPVLGAGDACMEEPVLSGQQQRRSTVQEVAGRRTPKEPSLEQFLAFDTYVFDCDGVIWGIPAESTRTSVATINILLKREKRVMFVTNNSNKSRSSFAAELEGRGVDFGGYSVAAKRDMVVSASFTVANFLKDHRLSRPFVITSDTGILEEFRLVGITDYFATVDDEGNVRPEFESALMSGAHGAFPCVSDIIKAHPNVDCVVVGWDLGFTARKMATAINYVRWHEDLHKQKLGYHPMLIVACSGDSGGVLGASNFEGESVKLRAVGNGPMAEVIARSFDPPKEWIDCGKPSDALLWLLQSAYDIDTRRALMVGDTIQTDICFGNRGGMKTLLVLSGVTSAEEFKHSVIHETNPMRRPTFVLPKLGSLYERGVLLECGGLLE